MKLTIKNKDNKPLVLLIEKKENQKGLVFIMHGLSGFKEQPHIEMFAKSFKEKEFTIIRFDTGNTCGESYGQFEDATVTQYLQDLEEVINYAKTQEWYQEPFYLVGHSLGGLCILLYTEKFPKKVKALAPISTVVAGKLHVQKYPKEILKNWKQKGIREWIGFNGKIKRLKWNFVEDGIKYDALKDIKKITMPCLLIVGENDIQTPKENIKLFYDSLTSKKEFHIIKGAEHTFRDQNHLEEIKNIFLKWINNVETDYK